MEVNWWDAACRGADPELWFPAGGHGHLTRATYVEAKRICNTCPIKAACLQYALDMERRMSIEGRAGIWGGKDEKERYMLACRTGLPCGVPTLKASYKRHLHRGETCPICRPRTYKKAAA